MRYATSSITFQEVPTEVSLTIAVTGCNNRCEGCHSPHLQGNTGEDLTDSVFIDLLTRNKYATCVTFLGGDHEPGRLVELLTIARDRGLKTALYTGKDCLESIKSIVPHLTYAKVGRYIKENGALNKATTNQKFYNLITGEILNYLFVYS